MRKSFLTYLRTHKITDIITINRLFLSIYILSNNYNINKNNHLRDLNPIRTLTCQNSTLRIRYCL